MMGSYSSFKPRQQLNDAVVSNPLSESEIVDSSAVSSVSILACYSTIVSIAALVTLSTGDALLLPSY